MKLLKRFWQSPLFLRLVAFLCVLGAVVDLGLLIRDYLIGTGLWRLHAGFLMLYIGQIFFILVRERHVSVLTILQGVLALRTAADFIFTPPLQLIGLLYLCTEPSLEYKNTYEYIFISAAFTLQMASAAYLWIYFRPRKELKIF